MTGLDANKNVCPMHGERTKEIEFLQKKVDSLCSWTVKHEKFADDSLEKQAAWRHDMEDKLHSIEIAMNDKIVKGAGVLDRKINRVESGLKGWAIAILTALVLNLGGTVLNRLDPPTTNRTYHNYAPAQDQHSRPGP